MIFKILMTLIFVTVCVLIFAAGIGVISESDDYLIDSMDPEEKKHWAQTHRRNRPPGGSEEA